MKVLCIAGTINPESGGWGRYSFNILNGYHKRGADFIVLTENATGLIEEERAVLSSGSAWGHVRNILRVRRMAKSYDVVHAFDAWPYGIYAFFAVLGTDKKLFVSGHGTYTVTPLDKPVAGLLMRRIYKRAQKIFCNSRYTASQITKRMPDARTQVVPLGANVLAAPSASALEKVGTQIAGRSPVILSVGALKKRKGQLFTLQALEILKKDFKNALYVIIGDDSDVYYKNQLTEFAKAYHLEDSLMLMGAVGDDELAAWYQLSHCLALNSVNHDGHFEGFGLVVVEAAQFGLPAVGSRDCGIEDAIKESVSGYLSDQVNPISIAEAIKKALSLDREGARAYSLQFDWAKTAKEYLESYTK